jgi:hypothetical protein
MKHLLYYGEALGVTDSSGIRSGGPPNAFAKPAQGLDKLVECAAPPARDRSALPASTSTR